MMDRKTGMVRSIATIAILALLIYLMLTAFPG